MKKKVLGVDFDDVLFKCNEALADFHNATYGTSYSRSDVRTFNLADVWDCTPEEAQARVAEFVSTDFHRNAEAVFGAYDALKALGEGYEIVIVTARDAAWRNTTLEWLEKNLIGLYREVHFTGQLPGKTSSKIMKSHIAQEIGASVFIDDALHHADDVATLGIPVLLFDTPWNQGETAPGITRVHSWSEILGILKGGVADSAS